MPISSGASARRRDATSRILARRAGVAPTRPEVSASVARLFSQHAADYQALAGQAAAFQEQFVQN